MAITDADLALLSSQPRLNIRDVTSTAFTHTFGSFHLEINQLPIPGQSVKVVVPLSAPCLRMPPTENIQNWAAGLHSSKMPTTSC
jgi:hypothetical protein